MKPRIVSIGLGLAVLVLARQASATVTVQGWWHFDGLSGGLPVDSSGNGRNYRQGGIVASYGFAPLAGALPSTDAAGGPLGTNGYTSSQSLRLGLEGDSDTFWDTGYVPPATNYGVEIWVKPQGQDPNAGGYWYDTGNEVWLFSSGGLDVGQTALGWGGACVRVIKSFGGLPSYIQAGIIVGSTSTLVADFGPQVPIDTNSWIHLALVNTNGVVCFYTNGVLCAVNPNGNETAPAGVMHLGTDGAWNGFNGFIDEERVFTFTNASDFDPATDLLYSATPRVVAQPQDTTVWATGAANLQVDVSSDPCAQYQWYLYGTNAAAGASATTADLYLNPVALGDSGQWYNCLVTNSCMPNSTTSSVAQLTVVPVNPDNVNAYRSLVNGETSLLAYYPADNDTGATLTDTKGGNNGTFQGGAAYDSQTNRAFGARAVFIKNGNGDVQIPSNSAYEFAGGNGTVEAVIYLMSPVTPEPGTVATIFSAATADGSKIRYQLGVSVDGGSLVYTNDSGVKLTWAVPVNLLNRFAHVAFVFSGGTSVTAYADGQPLGTLSQTGFGSSGVPCWIGFGPGLGAVITNAPSYTSYWSGTIDELALYGSALSSTDIAIHNSKFLYGTNTAAPSIVSQTTGPRTLYAGGSPVLQAVVGGTPPFTYQWTSNGVAITGATSPNLTLASTTPSFSATYSLNVTNLYGWTNTQPIALTFVSPPTTDPEVVAVMADHPTSFWPLNEGSGPTAIDYAGGNDGAYQASGVTYGVPGPLGGSQKAASFDGASGRVVVPFSPALNPSGPFTVEFWAQLNAYGFYVPISSMIRPARTAGYEFYLAGNYAGYEFHTAAGGGYNMLTGDGSRPPVGLWVHVAGVWDGTQMKLYINGYPASPDFTNSNPPFVANASTPFYIGCRSTSSQYFNGAMSDVAFYSYALSQEQLSTHFVIGQPLKLAITPSSNVIEDSNPSNMPKDGMNQGASWLASASGRNGVMQFNATNANELRVVAYPELAQTNLTIMFWMNSTGVVTSAQGGGGGGYDEASTLFFFRQPGSEGGVFIGLAGPSGWHPLNGIFIQGGNAGQGGVPNTIQDDMVVGDGTWHHVAVTIDTSSLASNSVALFVDGTYRASAIALRDWTWPNQNYTIQIGADNIGYDNWWNNYQGMLDDIRIYNTRLSDSDIATAMGGGLINSNLVLRYNFDTAPNGYVVTWPFGNLLTAPSVAGPYSLPGGLTNTPPYPTRSPFPVSKATVERLGMQYFGGSR